MHCVYALEDLPDPCRVSLFLARPDTVAVLPLFDPCGAEAEAFLVREHRLAVRNPSGFVVEAPGSSSRDTHLPPRTIAIEELAEELGLAGANSASNTTSNAVVNISFHESATSSALRSRSLRW
jgi:hypothetical protein